MIMVLKAAAVIFSGILLIVFGLLIRKTHRLTLIHTAFYAGVRPEDIRAYTSLMGFGIALLGIGICLTGLLSFAAKPYLMKLPALAGLIAGCVFMNRAQAEYNRQS